MDHKKLVQEIVSSSYGAKKDIPALVIHSLKHMGLNDKDMNKCLEEIKLWVAEN